MVTKKNGLQFPSVFQPDGGLSVAEARELAASVSTLFTDVDSTSALAFLLTGTLNMAARTLPRHVLDGIYAYETDQVYGVRQRVRISNPRIPPRRPRRG